MGFLVRQVDAQRQTESRATVVGGFHVSQTPPGWVDALAGWDTATGVNVTPENALEVGAVYACVRVLAESVAQLPLLVYRRLADGGKEKARDHYLYRVLRLAPNPEMTAFELRETLMGHLLTWGNAYAEVEIDGAGRVIGLWPLRPDRMQVRREAGELRYEYTLSKPDAAGWKRTLPAWQVFHLRGLCSDGLRGYSPVRLQRLGIGLARAAEEYGGRFFGNDARPGGVLEHPGKLSDEAHKRLRETWVSRHGGLEKSHRLAILEEGMKFEQIGLPPEDAQFLSTRQFQRSEIAGWYRVPPHMIGDLEHATFSNIEHQGIEFVTHSLGPWLARWEQRAQVHLLLPSEQERFVVEHLADALLRGDTPSRYGAYAVARQNGWLSANDIRELENMNPVEGGDVYLVPLNMVPADQVGLLGSLEDGRGEQAPDEIRAQVAGRARMQAALARHRLLLAQAPVFRSTLARVLRREINDVGAAAAKFFKQRDAGSFLLWLEDFYREHRGFVAEQLRPVVFSYGELVANAAQGEVNHPAEFGPELERFVQSYLERYARRHSIRSIEELRDVVARAVEDGLDEVEALQAHMEGWRESRPAAAGQDEAVRLNNAVARTVYILAGRQALVWVAMGKSCPYCNALNGRVVGILQNFLAEGEDFQPEGAEAPLRPNRNVGHAPAHTGCDCMVVAG